MPIFKIKNDRLTAYKEERFDLEKKLQQLIEKNLKTLFGLDFISSEFPIKDFSIDTLAYDSESSSFVIIEYKRGKHFSIVDQGLHYLSLLLNNKADFVLEYNQKTQKTKSLDDFDWSQVRVMFISRSFTQYQRGSINFRDFPIELWEVVKYADNTIDVHRLETEKKAESITKVTSRGDTSKITRQVKTDTVEDRFRKGWDRSKELFDELSEAILEVEPKIEIRPTKHYIGFNFDNRVVFDVTVRKSKLLLGYYRMRSRDFNDPEKKTSYRKNSYQYYNKHITDFEIRKSEDVAYGVFLAKQVLKKHFKTED